MLLAMPLVGTLYLLLVDEKCPLRRIASGVIIQRLGPVKVRPESAETGHKNHSNEKG